MSTGFQGFSTHARPAARPARALLRRACRLPRLPLLLLLAVATGLPAQTVPDRRAEAKSQRKILPNSGSDFVVQGLVVWTDEHLRVAGNLAFHPNGGELRIIGSSVTIDGDVVLTKNALLEVVDSTLTMHNTYSDEHRYRWLGGHLRTERATVGGTKINGAVMLAGFWLNNGFWDAKDTTVRYSGGIMLGYNRSGFQGQWDQRGGTLRADGLYQGEIPDSIHMSGWGDATVVNSVFSVGLTVYTDKSWSSRTRLQLSSSKRLSVVYGDRNVHAGVTHPLPASPYRLELQNTQVPLWQIQASNVTTGGATTTLVLDDAENIMCQVGGSDITGSPQLIGTWGNDRPGLPSTIAPGHHPMAPGNGVRIGNAEFIAGTTTAYVRAWDLYLRGNTDLTITGPTRIAELWLGDARVRLVGTGDFNAGIAANKASLHGNAHLIIDDGSVGEFTHQSSLRAHCEVFGCSLIELNRCRVSEAYLMARPEPSYGSCLGVDQGRIILRNPILSGSVQQDSRNRAGAVQILAGAPSQNDNLGNLGFESWASGAPSNWAQLSASVAGSSVVSPGSSGNRSLSYRSNGQGGSVYKAIPLPAGTYLDVLGMFQVKAQSTQSPLALTINGRDAKGNGNGNWLSTGATTGVGWHAVQPRTYVSQPGETLTMIAVTDGSNGRSDALVDDLRIQVANWWDSDNLYNLDFEDGRFRSPGTWPTFWRAPDGWSVWQGQCQSANPRASGKYALRLDADGMQGILSKNLSFTRPGDRVTVSGYFRGELGASSPSCWIKVAVGEGIASRGGVTQGVTHGTGWQPFSVTHVVPSRSTPQQRWEFTRIAFECYGGTGNRMYLDDVRVVIGR